MKQLLSKKLLQNLKFQYRVEVHSKILKSLKLSWVTWRREKKYKKALSSGEFALFTLIGTTDWEDYASLSIEALQLLTLAQINTNLEAIRKAMEE